MSYNEAYIRDQLAAELEKLELGLNLLDKEKYIPNSIGTRGFIDILAQDGDGRYVIIEVKKTDQASRDAAHEILKYVQGVKKRLRLRDDEVRVFVVSASWRELLVPFSYLSGLLPSELLGYFISVDANGAITGFEKVEPVALKAERLLAPWQNLYFYEDERGAREGKKSIEKIMRDRGVTDYVIAELHTNEENPEGLVSKKQITMRSVISQIAVSQGMSSTDIPDPTYRRAFLVALQQLSEDEYWRVLERTESFSEDDEACLRDELSEAADESRVGLLHEQLDGLSPYPESDFVEISYPAKFKERLREGWEIACIHRYGGFAENDFLHDDVLKEELLGSQGATGQTYRRTFGLGNSAQIREAREGVRTTLSDNAPWRSQLDRLFDEIVRMKRKDTARVSIFNPSSGLLSLYQSFTQRDLESWLPNYVITIPEEEPEIVYFGALQYDGSRPDYDKLIKENFDGKIENSLILLMHGGYAENDVAVMQSAGLYYRSYKMTISRGQKEYYKMTDGGWKKVKAFHPMQSVAQFFGVNGEFMDALVKDYASRWDGAVLNM